MPKKCPFCHNTDTLELSRSNFCRTCELFFASGNAITRSYYTPADHKEQVQVMTQLLDHPIGPVIYRGFEIVRNRYDGYVDYEASRDNHEWSFVAPHLPALLHIIWLITKDEP